MIDKAKYFVLVPGEDGLRTYAMDEAELVKRLNESYWGEDVEFVDRVPPNADSNYWGRIIVIIRGSVVVPKAIKVVKEFAI